MKASKAMKKQTKRLRRLLKGSTLINSPSCIISEND
jgi:hypothetical protein